MTNLRIGITQRTFFIKERNEKRDTIDTSLVKFFRDLETTPILISNISNDEKYINDYLKELNLDGFVLSGGDENFEKKYIRNFVENSVIKLSINLNLPVLGICRGMQFLNNFENGKLTRIKNHIGVNHKVVFSNGLKRVVNSFHKEQIEEKSLSKNFFIKARSLDNCIEMIEHRNFNWLGIMWHPERVKDNFDKDDIDLIQGFFKRNVD